MVIARSTDSNGFAALPIGVTRHLADPSGAGTPSKIRGLDQFGARDQSLSAARHRRS